MPPARAHPLLRFVRITVGYEEAFGEVGSVNAVVERLNHYSLERIVEVISRITLITAYYSGEDHAKGQAHVAAALFGKSVLQQIMRAVAARRGTKLDWKNAVLFHERQTLNLLKIALLSMPVDQPGAADDSLRPLGEALLMVNDLLDQGVVDSDPLDTDRKRAFELYLFANVFFNQSTSELALCVL